MNLVAGYERKGVNVLVKLSNGERQHRRVTRVRFKVIENDVCGVRDNDVARDLISVPN